MGGVSPLSGLEPVLFRQRVHRLTVYTLFEDTSEADIPYDKLKEMDEANTEFEQTDVVLVIGANDVVNPMARNGDSSVPISGMPILNVDQARLVVVVKRSLSPGFAGIPNPLFAADNTLMLFGDAKEMAAELASSLRQA